MNSDQNFLKKDYRPEIDGLRAIAVLAVLIFHANANWLPSGYLGVDIFFVISGYLITKIIYREMMNGEFSYVEFYKHRAKRILPAFLTVLIFATVGVYIIYVPIDIVKYNESAISSLFFFANLYFAHSADYFDSNTYDKPLLHTWSLSTEEQFYLIFPIILFLVVRNFKNREIAIISGLIIFSLLVSQINILTTESYYFPYLRFGEILIGALFSFFSTKNLKPISNYILISALIICLFIKTDTFGFINFLKTIAICIISAFLLISKPTCRQDNYVLNNDLMVKIGLISYSLYLWHWVFFAITRYYFSREILPIGITAAIIFLSFLAALLTYKFIENPIRRKTFTNKVFIKRISVYFLGTILFLLSTLPFRIKEIKIEKEFYWNSDICHEKFLTQDDIKKCKRGDPSKESKILITGDSHIGQYNKFFDLVGKNEKWSADVISVGNCIFLYGERDWTLADQRNNSRCLKMHEFLEERLTNYEIIILGGYWHRVLTNQRFGTPLIDLKGKPYEQKIIEDKIIANINKLLSMGKTIYFIEDNPEIEFEKKDIRNATSIRHMEVVDFDKTTNANNSIKEIVERYPHKVHWVNNILPIILNNNFIIDGRFVYYDRDHISQYGMQKMAEIFINSGQRLIQQEDIDRAYKK